MKRQDEPHQRIPLTVLTGYLGAGKTTLLNHILSRPQSLRYAVIVNEFGQIGIDNNLIIHAEEEILEMNNGCVCCTIRGDLIRIMESLLKRKHKFDAILIETTGLANPAPVIQTFFTDQNLKEQIKLDAIVAVADANWLETRLKDAQEAKNQIAFADVILLNKTDLVTEEKTIEIQRQIRIINPHAEIHRTIKCEIDPSNVLKRDAFELSRILALEEDFLKLEEEETSHDHHHHHAHGDEICAISLSHEGEMDPNRFLPWISNLIAARGGDILRSKGILAFKNEPGKFVFQGIHMVTDSNIQRHWQEGEKRTSKLVFIGRHLEKDILLKEFLACAVQP